MDKLFSIFGDATHAKIGGGDTFSDQLSCKYTVYIFAMIALLSTTRVFVDEPISCFCPAFFTDSHVDYAKKACWVTSTHHVADDHVALPEGENTRKEYISYYQWVPLFLAFQASTFYLPRLIWKHLSRKSGLALTHLTDASIDCTRKADNDSTEKIIKYLANCLSVYANNNSRSLDSRSWCRNSWNLFCSNYLISSFLFVKCMYIANGVGQIFLMNYFLGNNFRMYGFEKIYLMMSGKAWETSDRFPRVIFCDFYTRAQSRINAHGLQCVLPMNLFYEITYIFLWFWIVILVISSSCSFIIWLTATLNSRHQEMYIRRHLFGSDERRIKTFLIRRLGREGCFLIRLISCNSSDMIAGELVQMLWKEYVDKEDENSESGIKHDEEMIEEKETKT